MTHERNGAAESSRRHLLRRGLRLEYATLGWNIVGVVILAVAAVEARSVALAAFGFDSFVEIGASTIVIWQLTDTTGNRERPALRFVGWSFLALALYITAQAVYALLAGVEPQRSTLGIAWLTVTTLVMLGLAHGKAVTGRALNNRVLLAEGRVTLVDAGLAFSVLIGLLLNALLGWWWADPVAGFVIVVYGVREGRAALRDAAGPLR